MNYFNNFINYIQNLEVSTIIDFAVAIAVVILFLIFSPGVSYFILKIFFQKDKRKEIRNSSLYKGIRVFLSLLGVYIATKILALTDAQDAFCDRCFRVVLICTICNTIAGIIDLNQKNFLKTKAKFNDSDDLTQRDKFTVTMTSKVVKVLLWITAIYLSFKEFNFDIGGLAAGLGIGGAIVALAAQNIVKQMLSGLALVSDKPFEIGDWVEIGDVFGSVIAITWRSTKLKTMEDTIVTIDNSVVIASNIVNWSKIGKRVYTANLKLPLETDESTVEKIVNRIKFILRYNNNIIGDSIIVGLNEIQADALNISIYLEYKILDYNEAQKFKANLNLTILNILETQGINLSYPGRNIYIKEVSATPEKIKKIKNLEGKSIKNKSEKAEENLNNEDEEESKKTRPVRIKNDKKIKLNIKRGKNGRQNNISSR